jgi:hypothetical protein
MRLATCLLLALACKPVPPSPAPVVQTDLRPPLSAALDGGATLSELGGLVAVDRDDLGGCIVAYSVAAAMRTAASSTRARSPELPRVVWDASFCGDLRVDVEVDARVGLVVRAATNVVTAVLTSAPGLEARDCRGYRWGLASVAYVDGVAAAVLDELGDPDGRVVIPGVPVDLGGCP